MTEKEVIKVPVATDVGDIDPWFNSLINFLHVARIERGQLYAAVIALLLKSRKDSAIVGTLDDMLEIKKKYVASFTTDGDNLVVSLIKKEET